MNILVPVRHAGQDTHVLEPVPLDTAASGRVEVAMSADEHVRLYHDTVIAGRDRTTFVEVWPFTRGAPRLQGGERKNGQVYPARDPIDLDFAAEMLRHSSLAPARGHHHRRHQRRLTNTQNRSVFRDGRPRNRRPPRSV
jgi:hypothetical protein